MSFHPGEDPNLNIEPSVIDETTQELAASASTSFTVADRLTRDPGLLKRILTDDDIELAELAIECLAPDAYRVSQSLTPADRLEVGKALWKFFCKVSLLPGDEFRQESLDNLNAITPYFEPLTFTEKALRASSSIGNALGIHDRYSNRYDHPLKLQPVYEHQSFKGQRAVFALLFVACNETNQELSSFARQILDSLKAERIIGVPSFPQKFELAEKPSLDLIKSRLEGVFATSVAQYLKYEDPAIWLEAKLATSFTDCHPAFFAELKKTVQSIDNLFEVSIKNSMEANEKRGEDLTIHQYYETTHGAFDFDKFHDWLVSDGASKYIMIPSLHNLCGVTVHFGVRESARKILLSLGIIPVETHLSHKSQVSALYDYAILDYDNTLYL